MKKVLVLGAGFVARPLVRYLLDETHFFVTLADINISAAQRIIDNHPRGKALHLDIRKLEPLRKEVKRAEIVVSLLPRIFHDQVAQVCLEEKKHLVTTSYVSSTMKKLNGQAKARGILFLNEVGLDPGLDHMEAVRFIDETKAQGGKIISFISFCGGLPAPEAKNNPFNYKFSWSPQGVLQACQREARYLWQGKVVEVKSHDLFFHCQPININQIGVFEGYPNGDSLPYRTLYHLPEVLTLLRGTLRYPGWCGLMQIIKEYGLLQEEKRKWPVDTFLEFSQEFLKEEKISEATIKKWGHEAILRAQKALEWLGFYKEEPLPSSTFSPQDLLAYLMMAKMQYSPQERDMIILQHKFEIENESHNKQVVTSTLIEFGQPGGDSAMSRLVGLPAAIATRLILEEKINLSGVHIPAHPQVYQPILNQLSKLGINFEIQVESLTNE